MQLLGGKLTSARLGANYTTVATKTVGGDAARSIATSWLFGAPASIYEINFDAGTNGSTIGVGGVISAVTGTPQFSSSIFAHGGMSMHASSGTAATCIRVDQGTDTTHSGSLYLYMPSVPDTHIRFISFSTVANAISCNIRIRNNMKIAITDGATVDQVTGTTTIPTSQLVRIDWQFNNDTPSSPILTVRIYLTAEAAVGSYNEELTWTFPGTTNFFARTSYGVVGTAAVTTRDLYIDTIRNYSGLTWIGPYAAGSSTPISGTDTASVAISDISSLVVMITGTDTSSIAISESVTTDVSLTRTDTSSVSISESINTDVSLTRTDTSSIAIADSSSPLVAFSASDTGALSIAETSSLVVGVATNDTASLSVADVSTISALVAAADTASLSIAESVTQNVSLNANDTTGLSIADSSAAVISLTRTDTGAISISEVVTTDVSLSATDSGGISIVESRLISSSLDRADTSSISIVETTSQNVSISTSDTSALSIAEASAPVVLLSVSDTGSLSIVESMSLMAFVEAIDSGIIQIDESPHALVSFNTEDTWAISIDDVGSIVIDGVKSLKIYVSGAWHPAVLKIYIGGTWHELQINIRGVSSWL